MGMLNLSQLLMAANSTANTQLLERDVRAVSANFLNGVIDFLTKTKGVQFGPTTFGKAGANQQTAIQFVFPASLCDKNGDLAKIVSWKQNSESVVCREEDMDVKIARVRHERDENDKLVDFIELIVGAIQQDKNLREVAAPEKETKK